MTDGKIMGMTIKKTDNFPDWYNELVSKAKLIEYYDVGGCYIFLPNSYGIWENIQKYLDAKLKTMNVENVYFPLFITQSNLSKESSHIAGFTPEVAWVTQAGNSVLTEKLAVRPTSECAIYPFLPKLIQSHNDLPLKFNQWCSVVRFEFKDTTPFIRSREFLWQEGHTCYSNLTDAMSEIKDIINLYKKTYREMLAVPVIMGKKITEEKFAGAEDTFTVETFIPDIGKAVQAATAHCLGDNFSKIFEIKFNDKDQKTSFAVQNSWGFTTRSIGIMLMMHGDDKGAIIPPFVAPKQIVIIPVITKKTEADVIKYINHVAALLSNRYRVKVDTREHHPGWKYNYWELMGVPMRLEIGIKDVENKSAILFRRDTMKKMSIMIDDKTYGLIDDIMTEINNNLYNTAFNKIRNSISQPETKEEIADTFSKNKMCLINWCESNDCLDVIKTKYKVKSLCIPNDPEYNLPIPKLNCAICGQTGKTSCLFGRSY